jgi:hypothetical protein
VPKKSNPFPEHRKVGDKIRVSMQMHGREIVDATIKAVIETTGDHSIKLISGNDQTATVTERQIVKEWWEAPTSAARRHAIRRQN